MTSDGHTLRETWSNALNEAVTAFQAHLISGQSSSWKRIPLPSKKSSSDSTKSKAHNPLRPDIRDVSVYRKTTKTGDVYRIILDVPAGEESNDLEAWRATIVTPELRQEWDPAVESAQVLEMCDPSTRIIKTNFTLGWPANPRDAVLISRTFHDTSTLVDISTSLPRSPDEPSYLRPSPPHVRSHVSLFALCIQLLSPEGRAKRVRVTCFWQHDLKTVWNIGVPVSIPQQLSLMIIGLLDTVKTRQLKVPSLTAYGLGVSIERLSFDIGRAALTIDYVIVPEDQEAVQDSSEVHGPDDLYVIKEQRRLQRSLKFLLPSCDGWDIRVATRASSESVAQLPWSTSANRFNSSKVSFQIQHAPLFDDHSVLKVKLIAEYSAALKGVRVNGLQHVIENSIDHELKSFRVSSQLLKDASSAANVSLSGASTSTATAESDVSDSSSLQRPILSRMNSGVDTIPRGPAFDKSILARIRRNYIYFSSLLQEPEAKWKRTSDVRGVSVTQLDSIDPTLVVYKAEATFVGVGLWDLYGTIVTPGTRAYWDRQYEDATLLEDVNELTELWHFKTKPAWPVTGRDCVLLKTVYKSPTTIHVFSFSVDDPRLFPVIPPVDIGTIRTQVDLQGWAIEALSPTTTQLTLLEQSDPKGWSGKATVPQQMIAAVAGVGEFVIKHGGPPVVTRLSGARSISQKYDHDRGLFRVEYEPSVSRKPSPTIDDGGPPHTRHNSIDGAGMITPERSVNSTSASVECELRCDSDTWATSFDIVIDPPPQSITCLWRHRLSAGGGGLWLTFGHDIPFNSEEHLQAIVRRAPVTAAKEKGIVMINGKRISVDVEDLPESEVKSLVKQKRVKPVRVPLDQPPVMRVIRRRRMGMEDGDSSDSDSTTSLLRKKEPGSQSPVGSTAPKVPSPLSNFFTTAMEQVSNTTQQAVAALVPPAVSANSVTFPEGKKPVHFALDALNFAQSYHRGLYRDNWTNVAENGLPIQKRSSPEISPIIPVYRGERVIEGTTADEVASVVFSYDCRKQWDDRFDSAVVLEEFGADCHTAFLVARTGFPFRDRGLLVASLIAREDKLAASETASSESDPVQSPAATSSVIYCVSASFNPTSLAHLSPLKYNPHVLPIGRVYIDAWILETLDPYTTEKYAIPSTRCTRLTAFDSAGSVPIAFNTMINAALPRAILALESYMKIVTPFPEMRFPLAGFRFAKASADEEKACWRLHYSSSLSILLSSKLETNSKFFTANILVAFENQKKICASNDGTDRSKTHGAPKPSGVNHLSRPSSPDALRRERGDGAGSLSPSRRHRKDLSSSMVTTSPGSVKATSRSRERTRTSSSTFSAGRNPTMRGPTDFIVAEVIINLRTYPEGYEVQVASRLLSKDAPSRPLPLSQVVESDLPSDTLPIAHSVHLLPPSPLYTSGTGVDTPTRHLLRLTLPTAQYEQPTVEDPLTGETRNAPPKPRWYKDLEEGEKRAVVRVTLRPLPEDRRKKNKKVVLVDGTSVSVNEKDVYKSSVSDEGNTAVLSRTPPQEGEDQFALPDSLSSPLAVQDSLLDPSFASTSLQNPSVLTENQNDESEGNTSAGEGNENITPESPGQVTPAEEKEMLAPAVTRRGFLGYISSYQAPLYLLKFKSSSSIGQTSSGMPRSPLVPSPSGSHPNSSHGVSAISSSVAAVARSVWTPRYSLSTVIALVLIAFLLGSLLRSLLSPADFIYVVTDLGDVPEGVTRGSSGELGPIEPGWREIKRLVELKYIVGGWDFQIAVVRRH
ncbi:hypothetical protein ACEPAH_3768 [Sanghuangporus vaninii]